MDGNFESVLVTGGAGFIGSHLVERLLEAGYGVKVLDDLSTGSLDNLPSHSRLEFIEGDIADSASVQRAMKGCRYVFHLAAVASVQASIEDPLRTNRSNLVGTIQLLEAARTNGVRRFVFASSAAVFGDTVKLPVAEDAPKNPLSPYAADKLAGEHYLAHYHRQGWLNGTAFRFFNVYGPRQDPSSPYSGVISIFAKRTLDGEGVTIFGDGHQSRDFVFVADVVRILAASLDWTHGEELPVYNLGRGESVDLLELLGTIERITGRQVERTFAPARSGDIRHSRASIERLCERSNAAFTGLEEGLRETLGLKLA